MPLSEKIKQKYFRNDTFFSGFPLKKQKTKCMDQNDQTCSLEFLIFPNSIDDKKFSFTIVFYICKWLECELYDIQFEECSKFDIVTQMRFYLGSI